MGGGDSRSASDLAVRPQRGGGRTGVPEASLGLHQPCSFPEDPLSPLPGQGAPGGAMRQTRYSRATHPAVHQGAAGSSFQKKGMARQVWELE